MMLERGCAVNYLSKTGESALHILTRKGRFEAAMVLLTHGANANLKGQDGNTALHLAMKVCVLLCCDYAFYVAILKFKWICQHIYGCFNTF